MDGGLRLGESDIGFILGAHPPFSGRLRINPLSSSIYHVWGYFNVKLRRGVRLAAAIGSVAAFCGMLTIGATAASAESRVSSSAAVGTWVCGQQNIPAGYVPTAVKPQIQGACGYSDDEFYIEPVRSDMWMCARSTWEVPQGYTVRDSDTSATGPGAKCNYNDFRSAYYITRNPWG